jgi:hypothetical protein
MAKSTVAGALSLRNPEAAEQDELSLGPRQTIMGHRRWLNLLFAELGFSLKFHRPCKWWAASGGRVSARQAEALATIVHLRNRHSIPGDWNSLRDDRTVGCRVTFDRAV